ncbi:MAG: hypothetical protein OHK0023_21310 [Anaerolineae bacterium]
MRLMLISVVMLFGACFGLITAARAVGNLTTPSPHLAWFTHPNGAPCEDYCILGITRATLTTQNVLGALKAHPLTRDLPLERYPGAWRVTGPHFIVDLNALRGNPEFSVRFRGGSPPTAGSLIGSNGAPDIRLVLFSETNNTISVFHVFYFLDQHFTWDIYTDGQLLPTSAIASMRLVDLTPLRQSNLVAFSRWRGFSYRKQ